MKYPYSKITNTPQIIKVRQKNGTKNGKQQFKCYACGKQFVGGRRLNSLLLWQEYTKEKQTYAQLASKYNCSKKTIQRKLDVVIIEQEKAFPNAVNVLMDTTYFGRKFGVMVFKESITGKILFKQFVKQETNELYLRGIQKIVRRGIKIQSIICDGRKGLFQLFGNEIPMQMCNFHKVAIVKRYLTRKPKMQASKELCEHTLLLVHTDKESFDGGLQVWYTKWQRFLNEQKTDANGKKSYVHKKLRSAYRSLKTNLPWLHTWYDLMHLKYPILPMLSMDILRI